MSNQESIEYMKIQAGVGEHSLSFVLPKKYAIDLGIGRGDHVKSVNVMEYFHTENLGAENFDTNKANKDYKFL